MNVFDLEASLTMNISQYEKSVQEAKAVNNDLVKALQENVTTMKAMQSQLDSLKNEINSSRTDINNLKTALENSAKSTEKNTTATSELTDEIKTAKEETQDFDKKTDSLGDTAEKTSSKIGSLATSIKHGIVVACEAAIASVGAASAAIAALTKSSVSSYASNEQLVGGVDIMFKGGSNKVKENAKNAWKSIGLSENEYFETITTFASSLVQSIGKTSKESSALTEESIQSTIKAYDDEYKEAQRSFDRQYDALNDMLTSEINAYKKASEENINTIKAEYDQRMNLIDEEANAKIAAIDDEIAAINALADAENAERKKKKQEEKQAELEEKVKNARTSSERYKAQKDLAAYEKEIREQREEEERVAERKSQIDKLKAQKDSIKTEAQQKKEALKAERDQELNDLKEAQDSQIEEMKKSQREQLRLLKEYNSDRLSELKDYYTEQKKLYQNSSDSYGLAELTEEQYAEAADLADMALNDMSDNASVFGSNMQSIQNAYAGFAKQNYMMLDNLRLGYGGTKTEMERLLKDAEAISGVKYDINNYSDIIKAIHEIQNAQNITGNAAKEAEKTISGSLAATKAAWKNLVLELGKDNGDVEGAFNKLVDSVEKTGENIIPRIEIALDNISSVIDIAIPQIIRAIPYIIERVPDLVIAGFKIVSAIGKGIYDNREEIISAINKLPDKINAGLRTVDFKAVGENMSNAIKTGLTGIADFIDDIDWNQVGIDIAEAFNGIDWHGVLKAACDGMIAAIKAAPELIKGVVTTIDFDDLALVASLAFAPKFLMRLATELGLSEKWANVKTTMTGKMGEAGETAAGSKSTGLGFAGKFLLCVEAALAGWEIGTWIYNNWGDKIDAVLHPIFEKIDDAFNITGTKSNDVYDNLAVGGGIGNVFGKTEDVTDELLNLILKIKLRQVGYHAKGGIITSPQIGVIGENGAEAVIPLERNTEWIDRVAERLGGTGVHIEQVTIAMPEQMAFGSDYDVDRFVERVSERLEALKYSQNASYGGVNW